MSVVVTVLVTAGIGMATPQWPTTIGLDVLRELPEAPTGRGIRVTQVEASWLGAWSVDHSHDSLSHLAPPVTLVDPSSVSGHATQVALYLAGSTEGIAPGISLAPTIEALGWLSTHLLREDQGYQDAPMIETSDVQLHPWVADRSALVPAELASKLTRLLDFTAWRDRLLVVASLRNERESSLPDLLVHAYNTITVGVTAGTHSSGETLRDTPGRLKPDLVVPVSHTSLAVPVVGGAAALLMQGARHNPLLAGGDHPMVIKALLLTTADRTPFPDWQRTDARPMDVHFGAGELRIDRAWNLLHSGRRDEAEPWSRLGGWDQMHVTPRKPATYRWSISSEAPPASFTFAATWWREIQDTDPGPAFAADVHLPDVTLRLFRADNDGIHLVQASQSPVDNLELLAVENLPAGDYHVELTTDSPVEVSIAWQWDQHMVEAL